MLFIFYRLPNIYLLFLICPWASAYLPGPWSILLFGRCRTSNSGDSVSRFDSWHKDKSSNGRPCSAYRCTIPVLDCVFQNHVCVYAVESIIRTTSQFPVWIAKIRSGEYGPQWAPRARRSDSTLPLIPTWPWIHWSKTRWPRNSSQDPCPWAWGVYTCWLVEAPKVVVWRPSVGNNHAKKWRKLNKCPRSLRHNAIARLPFCFRIIASFFLFIKPH